MKKAAIRLVVLSASFALLASCVPGISSRPESSDPIVSESSSNSVSQPSVTTYKVVIRASAGLTITADKTEAAAGETVELTVQAEPGFRLLSIMLNGDASKIRNAGEGKYTFVMPDTSAVITTTVDVDGEAVVTGDVACVLEKQSDGTYKGTVTATTDANIAVKVANVEYGFVDVDDNHSFGNYERGRKAGCSLLLAGNAVYEISVNPNAALPLTIYRTGVLHAPTTPDELLDLFNGDYSGRGLLDGGAYYMRNLTGVNYRNFVTNVEYEWNKYEDGSSLGVATDPLEETPSIVYRAIQGDQYVVVDDYIEGVKDATGVYYDDSAKTDTVAYSAKYAVDPNFDEDSDPLYRYKKNKELALVEIDTPSHNMYSISREIAWGYRIGFTVEDDRVAASVKLTPTTQEDGSFSVDVYSWQNFDPSGANSTHSKVEREEYKIHLEFNKDSTLSKGTYLMNYYDETNWNFDNRDYVNGGSAKESTRPTVRRKSSFSYTFGAPIASAPDVDLTPYFIESLSNVHVTRKDYPTDNVQIADIIDQSRYPGQKSSEDQIGGYESLLSFTPSPSTALDSWQYGVVASSNASVIGLGGRTRYSWEALGKGTSTLTIGNHLGTNLATVDVTVINNVHVTGYYVSAMDSADEASVPTSSSVVMYSGTTLDVYLWGAPTNADPEPSITSSNPNLKVSLSGRVKPSIWNIANNPAFVMTLDATAMNITDTETVTLEIRDPMFESDRGDGYSTVSVTVKKRANYVWPSSIVGTTWNGDEAYTEERAVELGYQKGYMHVDSSLRFTDEDFTKKEGYKVAKLTATSGSTTRTIDVGYVYDPSAKIPVTFSAGGAYDVEISSAGDKTNGLIGLQYTIMTYSGYDDVTYDDVIGIAGDGENYVTAYQWFRLA